MTRVFALLSLLFLAPQVLAAAERYRLDTEGSSVGFTYKLQGNPIQGHMPVLTADMLLDLGNITASQVNVTLNAAQARAGLLIATDAMRGPQVLDTATHPLITFRSTRIQGRLEGAVIDGDLTVRGVTRPVRMRAALYQSGGTVGPGQEALTVLLLGSISRSAFGASGYPTLVDDMIDLRIIARILK